MSLLFANFNGADSIKLWLLVFICIPTIIFFSYSLTSQAVLAIDLMQSQLEVWLQLVAWFLIEEIGSTNITLLFRISIMIDFIW